MQDQTCPVFDDEGEMMCYYYDDTMETSLTHDMVRASERYEEAEKEYLFAKKHYLEAEQRLNDWRLKNVEYDIERIKK